MGMGKKKIGLLSLLLVFVMLVLPGLNVLQAEDLSSTRLNAEQDASHLSPAGKQDHRILLSALPDKSSEENLQGEVQIKPFSLYISGIDSHEDPNGPGRSDVNILVCVNPKNHQVLLVHIPRDSYLPILGEGNGEYDKLTHAGIYGVESSILTLEEFLQLDIDYYARVNFDSIIRLVDELDGVEIDNPYEFHSSSFDFPEGKISLNGEEALSYVRERYSLPRGDLSRGEHQQIVIEGLIQKILKPEILKNYENLIKAMDDSFETNFHPVVLMQLVMMQLADHSEWDVQSCQVDGIGDMRPSYAAGGQVLSVVLPDEASTKDCQQKIEAILAK